MGKGPKEKPNLMSIFLNENKIGPSPECLAQARQLVLDYAAQLPTDPEASLLDATTKIENTRCLALHAAGFLLANGILNVDNRDVSMPETPSGNGTVLHRGGRTIH
jgi:hypothetical protein